MFEAQCEIQESKLVRAVQSRNRNMPSSGAPPPTTRTQKRPAESVEHYSIHAKHVRVVVRWSGRTLTCSPKDTPSLNITVLLLYIQNTFASHATNPAHHITRCMPPNDAPTDQSRRKMGARVSAETEHSTFGAFSIIERAFSSPAIVSDVQVTQHMAPCAAFTQTTPYPINAQCCFHEFSVGIVCHACAALFVGLLAGNGVCLIHCICGLLSPKCCLYGTSCCCTFVEGSHMN